MAQGHNSFYEESSTKGSNGKKLDLNWKKILKSSLKVFKWATFLFLAITTLWGCVQEFTISTSKQLTQGLETYKNSQDILPNLYYLKKSFSYTSATKTDGEYIDDASKAVTPFQNILYPSVEKKDGSVNFASLEWIDADEAHRRITDESDVYDITLPNFTSTVTLLNSVAALNYFLMFDQSQQKNISGEEQMFLPFYNVDIDTGIGKWFIPKKASKTNDVETVEVHHFFDYKSWLTTEDFDLISTNPTLIKAMEAIDEAILYTNAYGFYNIESITPTDVIFTDVASPDDSINFQTIINNNLKIIDETENVPDVVKNYYDSLGTTYTTFDYNKIFQNEDGEVNAGISVLVDQATKKNNYVPSLDTYNYLYKEGGIDEIRSRNFESIAPTETARNTYNNDYSLGNVGWLFLDTEGNRIKFTNSSEEEFLQGQTLDTTIGTADEIHKTIDYWNKKFIDYSYKTDFNDNNSFSFILNKNEEINYKIDLSEFTSNNFLGFTSINNIVGRGVEYNQNIFLTPKHSIEESGLKGYNDKRIALSSWGEAWTYGPFYGMFVYPISMIANFLSDLFKYESIGAWSVLISVFIIVFFFRTLAALISLKGTRNSQKMQELQLEIAQINAKYEMYKDNKNMKQRKQMEIMALYKKEGVSPFSSFSNIFMTLPIFLAMWTIISTLPLYKVAAFGPFLLSVSPLFGIFNIFFQTAGLYLIISIVVGMLQFLSFKLPTYLVQKRKGIKNLDEQTKIQMKKNGKMMTIMLVVFVFIGLTIPTLLSIYWIFSSLFTIVQTLVQHYFQVKKAEKIKKANS